MCRRRRHGKGGRKEESRGVRKGWRGDGGRQGGGGQVLQDRKVWRSGGLEWVCGWREERGGCVGLNNDVFYIIVKKKKKLFANHIKRKYFCKINYIPVEFNLGNFIKGRLHMML